jgi:photosystem II stability/assembly factor-like uncharacterized protein
LFALTDGGSLYRYNLHAVSSCWERIETGLFMEASERAASNQTLWPADSGLLSLVFSTSNPQTAYLGTAGFGVYRTEDGGSTWTSAGLSGQRIWDLAIEPGNPQMFFAATDQVGVVKASLDGGNTWNDIAVPGVAFYSLEISPTDPGVLYAGTNSGVFQLSAGSWVSTGLSGLTVASLAFHPTNPNLVFAGTTNGAFISKDGGSTWQAGPPELAGHTVQSIGFNRFEPDMVFYNTTAHGVLRARVNP